MSEGILHCIRIPVQDLNFHFTLEICNKTLINIEDICILILNMPLIYFGIPLLNHPTAEIINSNIQREKQFDKTSLAIFIVNNEQFLNAEPKYIYIYIWTN